MRKQFGFSLVEILLVIVILATLVTIGLLTYRGSQHRAARAAVFSSVKQGAESLEIHRAQNKDYPPNFAGTEFLPSDGVVTALWTNAPVVRSYSPGLLTPEQNSQLFLNSCNANVPLVVGSTTYFTDCSYAGINIHVKGKKGSNRVLKGPNFDRDYAESELSCGGVPECAAVAAAIFDKFEEQGGDWPIQVSGSQVSLPEPDVVTAVGPATKYCIEGRSALYYDVVAHITSDDVNPQPGECPYDPELHYP